jgi:iron complex transport system ATP-binding protein
MGRIEGANMRSDSVNETILKTNELATGYSHGRRGDFEVCRGLDLSFYRGEVCALIGPNGAGKSTLLRTLAGLQQPLKGSIVLSGRPLERYGRGDLARSMAVVLTGRLNMGRLSCRSLISLARYPYTGWLRRGGREDEEAVERAMEAVGISEMADAEADELSDGEFEKVMIARALAQEPEVMLLDEPAAYLDFARRVELMHLLNRLAEERGMAVLVTSHDLDLVLRSADRVVLLAGGGTAAEGAPEDLVLSGELERVFSSSLVYFDMEEGSFRARQEQSGRRVMLRGSGQLRVWTARALQRAGYEPQDPVKRNGDRPREVAVYEGADGPKWELRRGDVRHRCTSLYRVIRNLEEI